MSDVLDPFVTIDRAEWAQLTRASGTPLSADELGRLRGRTDKLDMDELASVYLPLARLVRLRFDGHTHLARTQAAFLGHDRQAVPFVIGLAGSVAVGKSTTARVLQALLGRGTEPLRVEIVTTDGFLYPNAELERRGLMRRKGFPESYDRRGLLAFLHALKSGEPEVSVPRYSHHVYDVLPDEQLVLRRPQVVVVEGLNVLQTGTAAGRTFASDYFDLKVYVDAEEVDLERWYVERFLQLRATAFQEPDAYFHRYVKLSDADARTTALDFWRGINLVNLQENIQPTRERADLVLSKGTDHGIHQARVRKL